MAKKQPLVSVIVPVWNAEQQIGKLVGELLRQTYTRIEVVAVDDGSSDDSLKVLRKLAQADTRLKVVHQENAGVSAARNRGIDEATGDFLIFVDADDDVTENLVEALVEAIANPKVTLALTGKKYNKLQTGKSADDYVARRRSRRKNEKLSHYVIYLMIFDGRMYSMTSRIFRAEIIRAHHLRLEEGRSFAEDTKFTIDYLTAKDGEIVFIPQSLYIYNFGTETSLVHKSALDWENWERSYRELEDWARSENNGRLDLSTRVVLALVRLRWHISHWKAHRRAKKAGRQEDA